VGRCVVSALNRDAFESISLSYGCHKQTDDGRVVYITCIQTTCCGEIFSVHNVEIAHVTPTRVQNLKSLALTVAEILHGAYNSKTGQLTLTTPLSGKIFYRQGGTCYGNSLYQI